MPAFFPELLIRFAWSHARAAALAALLASAILVSISAAPAFARAGKERLDRVERRVIRLVNTERVRHGLRRLRADRRLLRAADFHSWDMARGRFFAHVSRNGTSASARVLRYRRAGCTGEAIASIAPTPERGQARVTVRDWLASPPHRALLLDSRFGRIGIARRTAPSGQILFTADLQSRL
jgi:uncharacterized protein YkwD